MPEILSKGNPYIYTQLPLDIIQSEVLPRLPAKSILRFMCVCKGWKSWLCTPKFSRMHLHSQTNYKLLLLDQSTRTFRTIDCEPPNHCSNTTRAIPFEDEVSILESLDGLLCVALKKTGELAFWNPLTGANKKVPDSFYNITANVAIAFYIDSCNDYKLLNIVSGGAFIYSQRLDSWRKNTTIESHYISNYNWSPATFLGGKLYFRLIKGGEGCVISFDVVSEKFKEIRFPPFPSGGSLAQTLVVLNGCLHLCITYGKLPMPIKVDLWRMDGDDRGWMQVGAFPRPPCNPISLSLRRIYTRRNGNWLAIWDDNNSIKNIDMEDFVTEYYYFLWGRWLHEVQGAIYIETLVSPNP